MTDDELVQAFESAELPADAFTHAAHVRVAWCYLKMAPFHLALARFATALQAFATAKSAAAKYHETLTVAWMALIAERLASTPDLDWDGFAETHIDLFAQPSIVSRCYKAETLKSERAKCVFLLPDAVRIG